MRLVTGDTHSPRGWLPALGINGHPPTGLRGDQRLPKAEAQQEAVSQAPGLIPGPPAHPLGRVVGARRGRAISAGAVWYEELWLLLILGKIASPARSVKRANIHLA